MNHYHLLLYNEHHHQLENPYVSPPVSHVGSDPYVHYPQFQTGIKTQLSFFKKKYVSHVHCNIPAY